MLEHQQKREPVSIAYHGNVVDLLEYFDEKSVSVELLSDQTSCHAVYEGGYTPAGLTHENARVLLRDDFPAFKLKVHESLGRHYQALKRLTSKGARFWDYGNSFMKAVFDAGVTEIAKNGQDTNDGFVWPSYVEDIMGPLCFDYGYGPFRWICLSGKPEDLDKTDAAAMDCIDPSGAGRTGTTTTGSGTRRRTGWWWGRRPASSTPTPRGGRKSPSGSTTWSAGARWAPSS